MEHDNKQYCKEWYQKNKDKHLQYCKERVMCECGKLITRTNLPRHKLNNSHKKRIDKLEKDKSNDKNIDELLQEVNRLSVLLTAMKKTH